MTVIDNAVYVNGLRTPDPASLDDTYEATQDSGGMAWIGLYRPSAEEIWSIANELDLHPLAVEDALSGHQRPKIERYGDTFFLVLRPARYIEESEEVEFGEVHLFIGPDFVVAIRHAESPDLARVRKRLEAEPKLLARGPHAVLYAILDEIVDEYGPVIAGLENDIDEIEDQLFETQDTQVSRRIYELSREVINFQRATQPLVGMLESFIKGSPGLVIDLEIERHLGDVLDHALRVVERADTFRSVLENALHVHATLVAQRQNDEMRRMTEVSLAQNEETKKISSWAAILFAPTLVGSIYGMNFDHMPELHWGLGYPFAIVLMFGTGVVLYGVFKFKKWL